MDETADGKNGLCQELILIQNSPCFGLIPQWGDFFAFLSVLFEKYVIKLKKYDTKICNIHIIARYNW